MLLDARRSVLLVVDLQERLLPAIHEAERVLHHARMLLAGAGRLGVPVVVTEQYPKGLGPTATAIREALPAGSRTVEKTAFSGAAEPAVSDALGALRQQGRDLLVVAGTEAHVCVLQTAIGFRGAGYEVAVVSDAVSSRAPHSVSVATARLLHAGCQWVTTEMVLFEWLARAATDEFRDLVPMIKAG